MDEKRKSFQFYFFIGTEAELIKLLPVIMRFEKTKVPFKIIASGQNNILKSQLLKLTNHKKIDIILYKGAIRQTAPNLLFWFIMTLFKSILKLKKEFTGPNNKKAILIIHGDTISTVMGAIIGRFFRLKIAHIEAGLRSFNYLHPFPEEIDRVITSRFADIHFCPNEWAVKNLDKIKGLKINTLQNTLYDSLTLVINLSRSSELLNKLKNQKYFIFIMHRQENLYNQELVKQLLAEVIKNSKNMKCLFVMHKPTILVLEKQGLMQQLKNNENIILTNRIDYVEFMKILDKCEYIITDGGSNQEETYYLGKPCLILRHHTERIEGLNENVVLSKNKIDVIRDFIKNYKKYNKKRITSKEEPSIIITDHLSKIA